MLYSSFEFIFLFLPIALFGFFAISKYKPSYTSGWLLFLSLIFYGAWNISFLPLLLFSICVNFSFGWWIAKAVRFKKTALVFGLGFNLFLLGYYKYFNFFLENTNSLFHTSFTIEKILFPLGISFITFQQVTYLIDIYQGKIKQGTLSDFALFVSFFPQLIAGPIMLYQELIPQLQNPLKDGRRLLRAQGIFLFSLGLCKKSLIADRLAPWVDKGFSFAVDLSFIEAWAVAIGYNFQIYFDFSAYSDMAMGIGWLMGIRLPQNFNSPYKADNIHDFWRRWHMTFSRFIRNYLYIPMGGGTVNNAKRIMNTAFIFFLTGLWHGAGWTYVVWGFAHAIALALYQFWKYLGLSLNRTMGILTLFFFCTLTRVVFRGESLEHAGTVMKAMSGSNGISCPSFIQPYLSNLGISWIRFDGLMPLFHDDSGKILIFLLFLFILCYSCKNSMELSTEFSLSKKQLMITSAAFVLGLLGLSKVQPFIYFAF